MVSEQFIKERQELKDKLRHEQAEQDVPAVKKLFLWHGIPGVIYNCATCFHHKNENCVGMDNLSTVCKYWFGPHLKDKNDWIPLLKYQRLKFYERFKNGKGRKLFKHS